MLWIETLYQNGPRVVGPCIIRLFIYALLLMVDEDGWCDSCRAPCIDYRFIDGLFSVESISVLSFLIRPKWAILFHRSMTTIYLIYLELMLCHKRNNAICQSCFVLETRRYQLAAKERLDDITSNLLMIMRFLFGLVCLATTMRLKANKSLALWFYSQQTGMFIFTSTAIAHNS